MMKKILFCILLPAFIASAQDKPDQASVATSIDENGTGKIIVEARGTLPEPPVFYSTNITNKATISPAKVNYEVTAKVHILQGEAETLSFHTRGLAEITSVKGATVEGWAVRWDDQKKRYLDIRLKKPEKPVTDHTFAIQMNSPVKDLPSSTQITNFSPVAEFSAGFHQLVVLSFANGVEGRVIKLEGFLPVAAKDTVPNQFQSAQGGDFVVQLNRSGATPAPVELSDFRLSGAVSEDQKSADFVLTGTATVDKANARLTILKGTAAALAIPEGAGYHLRLGKGKGAQTYELVFPRAGTWPVSLEFVASILPDKGWSRLHFEVATGAVAPLELKGTEENVEIRTDSTVIPQANGGTLLGFLPANGSCHLAWKQSRKIGEGKLFFSTNGHIETKVGAGLMRQEHKIDYRILQGELDTLALQLNGPGEILSVEGTNVVGWTVDGENDRTLTVRLSQALTESGQLIIKSQLALDAFPVRVAGMRITPNGTVRHSGFIRLSNEGSVSLEPTGLQGLTQLAPEQFPGAALEARQTFVYRFPAAEHDFEVAADRIQPEVNVSQLVLYQLAESDRIISADIELDIREAPIREWDLLVPADYSVVAVTGSGVSDSVAATEEQDGKRNLKVIFASDLSGRQLISLQLEKNETSEAGDWILPSLEFPGAESVRGEIGIVGAPGFRIAAGTTELLSEKPLSYFPKPVANLQQAFRIREPGWSATMQIELLEKSVQADVFHLYSLSEGTAYGSALINYFVTGAPVSELRISVPADLGNVSTEGKDIRSFRHEDGTLLVSLHQPLIGPYTLLVTFEEAIPAAGGSLSPGRVMPLDVQGERGFVQIVSPMQVQSAVNNASEGLLALDALELPAEFRLLSAAPSLGSWQYTERPFELAVDVNWFEPGVTATQVIEFSEINSRVSPDGELVSDVLYYVKSRGHRALKLTLPDSARLWAVSVGGKSVTARKAGSETLIPLPGGTDPNVPVVVQIRLGRPVVEGSDPVLALPLVEAPVLKTEWNIRGDERHVLVPTGGNVSPPEPVLRKTGFAWLTGRGLGEFAVLTGFLFLGAWLTKRGSFLRFLGIIILLACGLAAGMTAFRASHIGGGINPLSISLPLLSPGEAVELAVKSVPLWKISLSWSGLLLAGVGVATLLRSRFPGDLPFGKPAWLGLGCFLLAAGLLMQRDVARSFYFLLAAAILLLLFFPALKSGWSDFCKRRKERKAAKAARAATSAKASLLIGALSVLSILEVVPTHAQTPEGFRSADELVQRWNLQHAKNQLTGSGTVKISGEAGDSFLLLRAPAVLTDFKGEGLRLTRQELAGLGLCYIVTIPGESSRAIVDDPFTDIPELTSNEQSFEATFSFQVEINDVVAGFQIPTGAAAIHRVQASYDKPGWVFQSPAAVKIESTSNRSDSKSSATIHLSPQDKAVIQLKPKARDVESEETQFFVETSNLYIPGPGVVDGRHRIHIRPSQGVVRSLLVDIPGGITVSEVTGPISEWQFDAQSRALSLSVEPTQSVPFDVLIDTQRGLSPLPADLQLMPLRVADSAGEVGLVAIAFGPDAQPEKAETDTLSLVNLGDFDAKLLPNESTTLHRVYRYGTDGGEIALRVAPVAPEVRLTSKQVLSLGDERIVLGVNFATEITRAGLFQLSFPLPEGYEVESLSGDALHHWAELSEGEDRRIILHLNGKTIGAQKFSLSLTATTPEDLEEWQIPRFQLNEANRQTGDLIVKPTTGLRLRTTSRQNVSEVDPRSLGGDTKGSLAFRLLQRDWDLAIGVEKLDPWITGEVLHEVTLREGQTRTALMAQLNVQNASIRSVLLQLPITDEEEIKTLLATGKAVSDLVRTAPDSDIWEIQFKRRVVGNVDVRIEYERRGDRKDDAEILTPASFPDARQLGYHFAVRSGGRLELEADDLTRGWQRADWNSVPQVLRESGNRNAPVLTLRTISPEQPLRISAVRHSLAEALKLRVAKGDLTTVLSPLGEQLTAVDLKMDVIQRSSLTVGLPPGAELFSIFVNGESVHSVRKEEGWQFYILPGTDDRSANVLFIYSATGESLSRIGLASPQLNVPLENITWNVVAPKGFRMTDSDGDLDLKQQQSRQNFDRASYLSTAQGKREEQAFQAAELLQQANDLLQAGEQSKARWALNSVANQYALDAASIEDARVQLENLQTQQAVVGLTTRRQRLYLDNSAERTQQPNSAQIEAGIADNRIIQKGDLNFRPQELSQLLQGNTSEENDALQRIAARLVQHQRTTVPAPQAITITLPEEGTAYTFHRTVQVSENAPLQLDLTFNRASRIGVGRLILLLLLLGALAGGFAWHRKARD